LDEKEKQPEENDSLQPDEPSGKKPEEKQVDKEFESEKLQDEKVPESGKKHSKSGKDKQKKEQKEHEGSKKKDIKRDENFRYIVRIANTDLDGNKTIEYGLTQIKGVGHRMSIFILNTTGIGRKLEVGNLTDEQIEKLRVALENLSTSAPAWMVNHRRDFDTGEDMHLISTDVALKLRDDINLMKMIRCYRGVRHEHGLPVRGQRTKANGRVGLAMGVQKKAVQAPQAGAPGPKGPQAAAPAKQAAAPTKKEA